MNAKNFATTSPKASKASQAGVGQTKKAPITTAARIATNATV